MLLHNQVVIVQQIILLSLPKVVLYVVLILILYGKLIWYSLKFHNQVGSLKLELISEEELLFTSMENGISQLPLIFGGVETGTVLKFSILNKILLQANMK